MAKSNDDNCLQTSNIGMHLLTNNNWSITSPEASLPILPNIALLQHIILSPCAVCILTADAR